MMQHGRPARVFYALRSLMRNTKHIALILSASMVVSPLVPAAMGQNLPAEQIRQGEARQQQIKAQTDQVSRSLDALIDEFRRNGLDGADVDVLRAIRGILGKLTDREMQKVIELLQEARSAPDASGARRAVAGAGADQQTIVAQMRQLL